MLNCLFWNFNYHGPDQEAIAASVALYHEADILILAEAKTDPVALLRKLQGVEPAYEFPEKQNSRFLIFTKFPGDQLGPYRDHDRMSVRSLRLPGCQEVLFAVIHFYDRRNHNPEVQHSRSSELNITLRSAEIDAGHCRTLVVGDFNMNPFEKGMIDANIGFGALMSRGLTLRHSGDGTGGAQRFYNPMWSRLGRSLPDAPGNYYWLRKSAPLNLYWHSLDQVLIRPGLFDSFRDDDLRVLTSIPGLGGDQISLIKDTGKHWKIRISDHLPILFQLSPPEEHTNA